MATNEIKRLSVIKRTRKTLMDHMNKCKVCDPMGGRCEKGAELQQIYRRSRHSHMTPSGLFNNKEFKRG